MWVILFSFLWSLCYTCVPVPWHCEMQLPGGGGGGGVWIGNVASKHPWCWGLAGCAGPAPLVCWPLSLLAGPTSMLSQQTLPPCYNLPFSPAPPTAHLPHHSSVFTVAILSLFYVCLWFVPLWHVWTAYFMCVCGFCGMFEQLILCVFVVCSCLNSLFYVCLSFVPLWHVWTAYFMCVCRLFLCGMFEQLILCVFVVCSFVACLNSIRNRWGRMITDVGFCAGCLKC